MDNKKDTSNNSINPIGQIDNGHAKNLDKIIEFANSFVSFSYKKSEQLGLAIYMVSECFEESEPMRESLRDLTLDIIAEIHVLHSLPPFEAFMHFEIVQARLHELAILVRISEGSGMISNINADIINSEISFFEAVLSYVREKRGSGHKDTEGRVSLSIPMQSIFNDEEISQSQNTENIVREKSVPSFKKDIGMSDKNNKKTFGLIKDKKTENDSKSSRRNMILKVIQEKKSVTIKDIMTVIKDCSEKTIQRELVSLMKDGILKREGEKRWAKYSIK